VRYETRRIALLILAALAACFSARALPSMPPIAGVVVRGTTVIVVYGVLLALTGFFKQEELRVLAGLRGRRGPPRTVPPPEVTELGGEIVAAEILPGELDGAPDRRERR
jgi:hypothetical protein